ncbi:hypothetical protein V2E39_22820 [Chryseobacterium arthrosphaerae]|uniref:Uncharacterized protein n=1 Tax=Chryseobacterium arthrosphaerae TaxID=651561 RepID=A0ABU7R603_9FLAO
MKQLEIKTNKRLLIVEIEMAEIVASMLIGDFFPNYQLEFICKGADLTEEVAEDLVETLWKGFKNYNEKEPVGNYQRFVVKNALESFISAIESKGWYWENPLGVSTEEIRQMHGDASDMFKESSYTLPK